MARCSGDLLPPSPPAEKATASKDQNVLLQSFLVQMHFLDKASRDLFICAKDLFVAANGGPAYMGPKAQP